MSRMFVQEWNAARWTSVGRHARPRLNPRGQAPAGIHFFEEASRETARPSVVIPAQAGIHLRCFVLSPKKWIPACAGMTDRLLDDESYSLLSEEMVDHDGEE